MGQGKEVSSNEDPCYSSDDFRVYCFKILPCDKRYIHDWLACPYAHQGEKARRRDPRLYNPTPCATMKRSNKCPRGDACPYAHNVFEFWLHPARYRTQMCTEGTSCTRKVCFFAHIASELRAPPPEVALLDNVNVFSQDEPGATSSGSDTPSSSATTPTAVSQAMPLAHGSQNKGNDAHTNGNAKPHKAQPQPQQPHATGKAAQQPASLPSHLQFTPAQLQQLQHQGALPPHLAQLLAAASAPHATLPPHQGAPSQTQNLSALLQLLSSGNTGAAAQMLAPGKLQAAQMQQPALLDALSAALASAQLNALPATSQPAYSSAQVSSAILASQRNMAAQSMAMPMQPMQQQMAMPPTLPSTNMAARGAGNDVLSQLQHLLAGPQGGNNDAQNTLTAQMALQVAANELQGQLHMVQQQQRQVERLQLLSSLLAGQQPGGGQQQVPVGPVLQPASSMPMAPPGAGMMPQPGWAMPGMGRPTPAGAGNARAVNDDNMFRLQQLLSSSHVPAMGMGPKSAPSLVSSAVLAGALPASGPMYHAQPQHTFTSAHLGWAPSDPSDSSMCSTGSGNLSSLSPNRATTPVPVDEDQMLLEEAMMTAAKWGMAPGNGHGRPGMAQPVAARMQQVMGFY